MHLKGFLFVCFSVKGLVFTWRVCLRRRTGENLLFAGQELEVKRWWLLFQLGTSPHATPHFVCVCVLFLVLKQFDSSPNKVFRSNPRWSLAIWTISVIRYSRKM